MHYLDLVKIVFKIFFYSVFLQIPLAYLFLQSIYAPGDAPIISNVDFPFQIAIYFIYVLFVLVFLSVNKLLIEKIISGLRIRESKTFGNAYVLYLIQLSIFSTSTTVGFILTVLTNNLIPITIGAFVTIYLTHKTTIERELKMEQIHRKIHANGSTI